MNDQATSDIVDDRLLPGATFAFYADDGDGVFEPDGGDAPRLAEVGSDTGFHVWTPPGPGRYWVVEIESPPGFDIADPLLVDFLILRSTHNCVHLITGIECVLDDDPDGGYVVAVVGDSPIDGGVGPLTPPPTDGTIDAATSGPGGLAAAIGGLLVAVGVALFVSDRRRPSRR